MQTTWMGSKIKLHLMVVKFIIASVSGAIKSICWKKFDLSFSNQEKARKLFTHREYGQEGDKDGFVGFQQSV